MIFTEYLNADGLVTPDGKKESGSTGNGILYTAEMAVLITRLGLSLEFAKELQGFYGAIRNCQVRLHPGLYHRHPPQSYLNQIDDYIGIAAFAALGNPELAQQVLQYSEDHKKLFNNEAPDSFRWDAWFGRYPQAFYALKLAAGKSPSWFETLAYKANILLASLASDSDTHAKILNDLLIFVHRKATGSLGWAEKRFYKSLQRRKSYALYFGETHPLALEQIEEQL